MVLTFCFNLFKPNKSTIETFSRSCESLILLDNLQHFAMQRVRGPKSTVYVIFTYKEIMCVATKGCGGLTPRLYGGNLFVFSYLEYCIPLKYDSHDGWCLHSTPPPPSRFLLQRSNWPYGKLPQIQTHAFVTRFQATQKWG
jgi:hypothetical protein